MISSFADPGNLPPICVDGRMLEGDATGVGTYARNLVSALRLIACDRYVLRAESARLGRLGRFSAASSSRPCRVAPGDDQEKGFRALLGSDVFRVAQERFTMTRRMLALSVDMAPGIMHWTYPVPLRMLGWRNVYTVHDVIPLEEPALVTVKAARLRAMLSAICRDGDAIVTVSEDAKSRILAQLGCDPGFVVNCYQAVQPPVGGGSLPVGLKAGQYLLYCGSAEPRKNLGRLVEAYRRSGVSTPLILAGIGHYIRADTDEDGVVRLPFAPRAEMDMLIRSAKALLFPSLAEGFGLPIVEAMAAGVPVLTANRGATAEIAGRAALLVDPEDVTDIARGVSLLDGDKPLRDALRARGLIRSAAFGVADFAERLSRFYARVAVGPGAGNART